MVMQFKLALWHPATRSFLQSSSPASWCTHTQLLKNMRRFSSKDIRRERLYEQASVRGLLKKVKTALKGFECVYTRHTPPLMKLVKDFCSKQGLSEDLYLYPALGQGAGAAGDELQREVMCVWKGVGE